MPEMTMVARVAQYALNHPGRVSPMNVADELGVERKAVQSAFNGLVKRGLFKNVSRGSYRVNRAKLAEAFDFSDFSEEIDGMVRVRTSSPRFKPAPFIVMQDSDGGLWLAEKLR